ADAAAAARNDSVRIAAKLSAIVRGKIAAAIELITGEHKAAALDGDVANRCEPGIARIGGWRAVKLDAFRVHRSSHQRQIIFPADDCAEFAERRLVNRQRGAVTEPPDEALGRSRHKLAMLAEVGAVRREEKNRAVKSAAVALDDSNNEINTAGASDKAEGINGRAGNIHAAFPIALKITAAILGAIANDGAEVESTRIGGDKRLREDDETCPFRSSLRGK